MASDQSNSANTFRLAFLRKIRNLFQSPTVKAVLLNELRVRGPDAELLVPMLDKVQARRVVKPVQPVEPQPVPAPGPAIPNVVQADPVPTTPYDVQVDVPRVMDGSSEESALEVMDSEDELVSDMVLTPSRSKGSGDNSGEIGQAATVQINKHSFKPFSY